MSPDEFRLLTNKAPMNFSQLTRKERKILTKVAKPYFPAGSLWCIILLAADGIAAIVFSFRDCLITSEMVKNENPEAIMVLVESLLLLILASTALFSAIWLSVIRSYGMLLRKFGSEVVHAEKPKTT
jgi:uncharacterized membrane protein YhfC